MAESRISPVVLPWPAAACSTVGSAAWRTWRKMDLRSLAWRTKTEPPSPSHSALTAPSAFWWDHTHKHTHTRMIRLLKYLSALTKSVLYGFRLKFLQTNVSERHRLPVYILQLLVNEGTHLVAGTCRKTQVWSTTKSANEAKPVELLCADVSLITSCTPSQDSVYLPAGVTRHCQTGCLWDLRSGSSAEADPSCPERAQRSSNEDTREGLLISLRSVRHLNFVVSHFTGNKRHILLQSKTEGPYLVYIHRLLFRLYGLHLDVLAELYCLLLCLHCTFQREGSGRSSKWVQVAISYTCTTRL